MAPINRPVKIATQLSGFRGSEQGGTGVQRFLIRQAGDGVQRRALLFTTSGVAVSCAPGSIAAPGAAIISTPGRVAVRVSVPLAGVSALQNRTAPACARIGRQPKDARIN